MMIGTRTVAQSFPRVRSHARWCHVVCSVWWATPAPTSGLVNLLDDVERERAARLALTTDHARYVTAHALVRLLVAARTGVSPEALCFDRTCPRCGEDHGKPRLRFGDTDTEVEAGAADLRFNLAQAGDRIVVAVAEDSRVEVGVDIERIPGAREPVLATGAAVLTRAERTAYRRLDPALRGHALALWWVRKEAVLKARGDGLIIEPSRISGMASDTPRRPIDPRPVGMQDLEACPGYVGCVAVLGADSLAVVEHDARPLLSAP